MAIPGEDVYSTVIHPRQECISSPGMGVCLTRNGSVPYWEWGCALPEMHILTGNGDVPHQECKLFIQGVTASCCLRFPLNDVDSS